MKSRETMIRLHRFEVDEKRQKLADIESMVSDFQRMVVDLDHQILAEQEKSGVSDVTHFAYPTFAKAAIQRRENLQASITELDGKLSEAQEDLAESFEELKKVELIEQRDNARDRAQREAEEQSGLDELARGLHMGSPVRS